MYISLFASRRRDMRATVRMSVWTVEKRTRELLCETYDVPGPLPAVDACVLALEVALAALRRHEGPESAPPSDGG